MLTAKLLTATLIVQAAIHPLQPYIPTEAEVQRLNRARELVIRCVTTAIGRNTANVTLADKIVEAVKHCQAETNAMQTAYIHVYADDRNFFYSFFNDLEQEVPKRLRAAGH